MNPLEWVFDELSGADSAYDKPAFPGEQMNCFQCRNKSSFVEGRSWPCECIFPVLASIQSYPLGYG